MNLRQRFPADHLVREFQIRFLQRPSKTAHSIAVLPDIFPLRLIQNMSDVSSRITARFDECNEILDELFEKHVVLPQRVVGIDHECVASHGDSCSATLEKLKLMRSSFRNYVSLPASGHLRRWWPQLRAWPSLGPRRAFLPAAPHRPITTRFSRRPREDCCTGSPRPPPANDRRCVLPARESVRSAPSANGAQALPMW